MVDCVNQSFYTSTPSIVIGKHTVDPTTFDQEHLLAEIALIHPEVSESKTCSLCSWRFARSSSSWSSDRSSGATNVNCTIALHEVVILPWLWSRSREETDKLAWLDPVVGFPCPREEVDWPRQKLLGICLLWTKPWNVTHSLASVADLFTCCHILAWLVAWFSLFRSIASSLL